MIRFRFFTGKLLFLALLLITFSTAYALTEPPTPPEAFTRPTTRMDDRSVGEAQNLELLGHWADGGSCAIVVDGEFAYHGRGGIVEVFELASGDGPAPALGQVTLPSLARDMVLRDGLLYVAGYNSGLWILDVTTPAAIHVISQLELPGTTRGLVLVGDHAWLACGSGGLAVVDVFDPTQPTLVSNTYNSGYAWAIDRSGDIAILASDATLQLHNMSDPTSPHMVGSVRMGDGAIDVVVDDNLAYVAGFMEGLRVFDITESTAPVPVSTLPLYPWVTGVAKHDDLVCASMTAVGFSLIDVSNPAVPFVVGSVEIPHGDMYDAFYDGQHVYGANGVFGLYAWDVTDPTTPKQILRRETFGPILGFDVKDDLLAAACMQAGLRLVDVTDPVDLVQLGSSPSQRLAWSTALGTPYSLLCDDTSGFAILDLADPLAPVELGRYTYDQYAQALGAKIVGSLAYLAFGSTGDFRILDITDPATPLCLGILPTEDIATAVDVTENMAERTSAKLACIANQDAGCVVVDVNDPTAPKQLAQISTPGLVSGVAISGLYAYVGVTTGSLRVIDLSAPQQIAEVGHLTFGHRVLGIAAQYPYVYLACADAGVRLVDVTDPTAPVEVGFFQTGYLAWAIRIWDDTIYVSDWENGFWILRNELISIPLFFQNLSATRQSAGCRLSWRTSQLSGLERFTIWRDIGTGDRVVVGRTKAHDPGQYSYQDPNAPATGVSYWIEGNRADGTSDWFGPATAPPATPTAAVEFHCWPNPFNPTTTFEFAIPHPGPARLEVTDLRGFRLDTLWEGWTTGGSHTVTWNGRDAGGRPVATGVYLAQLIGSDFVRSLKVVMIE